MAVGAAENADSAGMRLARARARLGLSVEEVADQLKLDPHTIVALEAGDHRAIGATVFVRGFLRRYAALVGESPAEIEALYARHPDAEFQPDLSKTGMHRIAPASYRPKIRPWPALVAALALVATGTAWWALRSRPASVAPAPASQPVPAAAAGANGATRRPSMPAGAAVPAGAVAPATGAATTPGEPPAVVPGRRRVRLAFSGECWAEVYDARGYRLFFGFGHAGTTQELERRAAVSRGPGQRRSRDAGGGGRGGAPAGQCARRARARHARRQRRRHGLALGSAGAGSVHMSKQLQAVRGMNDVLPAEIGAWQYLERELRALLWEYGYEEMRVPVVEHTELFRRSIGEHTDIVEKEMYTFTDTGGDSLTLRPEATAGIARAVISNGLLRGARLKLWTSGPMFRHERPQQGRFRQFHQFSVEAIGFPGPDVDAELIALGARLWRRLGITRVRLMINSLGTSAARAQYRAALLDYCRAHEGELDADSRRRLEGNPLRILDSKNPAMRALIDGAPLLSDHLDADSRAHFSALRATLDGLGIRLCRQPAAGARIGLLFTHRVRVDHRRARRAGRGLLRGTLRRPAEPAGRRGHARHRLRARRRARGHADRRRPAARRRRVRRRCTSSPAACAPRRWPRRWPSSCARPCRAWPCT